MCMPSTGGVSSTCRLPDVPMKTLKVQVVLLGAHRSHHAARLCLSLLHLLATGGLGGAMHLFWPFLRPKALPGHPVQGKPGEHGQGGHSPGASEGGDAGERPSQELPRFQMLPAELRSKGACRPAPRLTGHCQAPGRSNVPRAPYPESRGWGREETAKLQSVSPSVPSTSPRRQAQGACAKLGV